MASDLDLKKPIPCVVTIERDGNWFIIKYRTAVGLIQERKYLMSGDTLDLRNLYTVVEG